MKDNILKWSKYYETLSFSPSLELFGFLLKSSCSGFLMERLYSHLQGCSARVGLLYQVSLISPFSCCRNLSFDQTFE